MCNSCMNKSEFRQQEEPQVYKQVYKTKDGETITYSETDGYKVCDEETGKCAKEHPVNLEEAAEEYAPDFSNSIDSKEAVDAMRHAFKAGAEWAEWYKEQKPTEYILKEKVNFIIFKLRKLSFSNVIPMGSEEFKQILEIEYELIILTDMLSR